MAGGDNGGAAVCYPAKVWKNYYRREADGDDGLVPPAKRRKPSVPSREEDRTMFQKVESFVTPQSSIHEPAGSSGFSFQRRSEGDVAPVMSRDEIERCSPSRKDGIDKFMETRLRYSYCVYLQNLGLRLDLPQATVGTAMLIATAVLFLAGKSEETPCLLDSVLMASFEICQKQNFAFFPQLSYNNWFEQYRERVIEAEQLILTTLNFELEVEHPYVSLASVLNKLGLQQTVLLNLAWSLVNEGLRSSLWLQFKPHHIAAGAACLAAKFLNFDLMFYHHLWQEFRTTEPILEDVIQQLMELL
ncbi:hypothetical protein HPP92_027299 [Vanilla planifolia]|uniref:Cyclin N-terminal domain-containing protein n=1 Tax=Vanilla planifolia TaxID=51239 RepID=A0A835P9D2_VANPL|nr:hypothetical protein HPP92_027299 [Vanilla planifolia]KAG0449479.1 hypothetical protein HPP92_027326 [Vanilla planifolia]